jgi:tetratricopeptide (TPR) repeat protein
LALTGRDELLADLHAGFESADLTGPQITALFGLGGVGKTCISVEHAHRHLAKVGIAWQFHAEDPAVLRAEFGELAAQLGARDLADTRDPVITVHAVLAYFPAKWLLIFDNARDWASVVELLPPAGRGQVLISSQSTEWSSVRRSEVPVLPIEVAAGFLMKRTGHENRGLARHLAFELGGLPLALEQAAAYMRVSGDDLGEYLVSFKQWRTEILRRGDPSGYSKTVATAWMLAFDRLEQSAPNAVTLLRLLANFAPEAVPLLLILRPRSALIKRLGHETESALTQLLDHPLTVKDAVGALRRFSLVSAPADGFLTVHRLVQMIAIDQMSPGLAAQWQQAAAVLVEAAIPQDPERPEDWRDFAALLPHARKALPVSSDGLERIAHYLGFSGSYVAARDLEQKIVEEKQSTLGSEHPDVLTARAHLARWTGAAGNWIGARDQFAALLPLFGRVLKPEHPDTLRVRGNLAYWTGQAGDPAGARDHFAALLSAAERLAGPEDLEALSTRYYLARWTGEAGDADNARDLFAELVRIRTRVSGSEHLETLRARQALAHWTGQAGDPTGARDLFAELLPIAKHLCGSEHPDTLHIHGNLARWSGEAGDAAGARDLFAELLPIRETISGPEHPDTLRVRHELARWTGQAGDPSRARDLFAELLPVAERVCGPGHPDTLHIYGNLAHWSGRAGAPLTARDLFAALLPIAERVGGPEHPDVLTAWAYFAQWTGEAGDAAGACEMFSKLLPVRERVSGPEHPDSVRARKSLAYWQVQLGRAK